MVKLLGAVLVVGSFGVIGSVIASGYSERPRQLSALISGLALLETEISYSRTPLSEALIRAKGQKGTVAGRLFEIAACIIAEGDLSPGQAWEAAVRCIYPFSALTPEDREALLAFGSKLGSCSTADQLKQIALVKERLKANETCAREKASETARMWRYLGLTVGAMITLMLY